LAHEPFWPWDKIWTQDHFGLATILGRRLLSTQAILAKGHLGSGTIWDLDCFGLGLFGLGYQVIIVILPIYKYEASHGNPPTRYSLSKLF